MLFQLFKLRARVSCIFTALPVVGLQTLWQHYTQHIFNTVKHSMATLLLFITRDDLCTDLTFGGNQVHSGLPCSFESFLFMLFDVAFLIYFNIL